MQKFLKLQLDIILIFIWTILAIAFMITPSLNEAFIRKILIIPIVLFIPGYVLIAAIFPKKEGLEYIERLALSFGLSVAVVFVLDLLAKFFFGKGLLPVLLSLCLSIVIITVFVAYRRAKLPPEERFDVPFHRMQELLKEELEMPKSKTDRIITGILIFSIVLAIGMLYYVINVPKIGEKFTEFYILGPAGKADNYSSVLHYNYSANIVVGVVNHEYVPANYTVRIVLDKDIMTDRLLFLDHNTTWENNVSFVPDKYGTNMKLEFWLFKEDNFTAPYRELYMWVTVNK